MDDEVIRIMVATDNHLGFAERDPVRCNDSFAAFEEVLRNAHTKKADFVLFAGDMFHENKPSRHTMHSCMELLRTYCLGENPVYIEVLNDQREIFKSSMGKVNYEDPYQSIGLPVFSIHGNHDDPSREGGQSDSLAALDLLAVSNLINYFGKAERVEDIEITPILIRKGTTNLAIYGLGAMRDERLNRMWNQKRVRFVRLTVEQGRESFFNIFVLHQNRDYGRGKKNCVHESMIPEWMDLVIWGNEHECQPTLNESLVGTYRILQPGSSIATSLSAGESSQCPKHMAFFEIREKKFRMKAFKFTQNRHFIYSDICLKEVPRLDPAHPKIEEQVKTVVDTKVNQMLIEGRNAVQEELHQDDGTNNNTLYDPSLPPVKYTIKDPHKILIRLRVDHEGYPALNQQRFGAQYVGEVANPSDIILLSKKKREAAGGGRATERGRNVAAEDWKQILAEGDGEEIHKIRIEDMVNETLANSKNSLSLMAEAEMAQALDDFIVKKQPSAILDLVTETLERTQTVLNADRSADDKNNIVKAVEKVKQKTEEEIKRGERARKVVAYNAAAAMDSDQDEAGDDSDDDGGGAAKKKTTAAAKGKGKTTTAAAKATPAARGKAASTTSAAAKKATAKSTAKEVVVAPAKRNVRAPTKKVASYAVDNSDDDVDENDEDVQMIVDESEEDEAPTRGRGGNNAKKTSNKNQVHSESDAEEDDELVDSEDYSEEEKPKKGRGGATSSAAKRAPPTKKPTQRGGAVIDLDDDEGDGWKCSQCTYENVLHAVTCEMCGAAAPNKPGRATTSKATTTNKKTAAPPPPPATPSASQLFLSAASSQGGVKKRQLPGSFSQALGVAATQRKAPGQDKKLTEGWD